ncbi:MAG: glycoside hydrolase family 3 N-terminal domain-containing protein [Solirubrobacterales bacterium]
MSSRDRLAQRRRAVARRRRNALIAVAVVASLAGVVVGAGAGAGAGGGDSTGGPPPSATCPPNVASSPKRLAGAMLMVRMEDTATDELLRFARHGELGGVILFPSSGVAPSVLADQVGKLAQAARKAGYPEPLVAIDQEGGDVKRLPDEPPDIAPSAIAKAGGAQAARAQGLVTGNALSRLGIDVDLAPVLDLGEPDSFVSSRTFGDDPSQVAGLGLAFADGLADADVAATAKHFPGLGLATDDTDAGPSTVDASRADLAPGLEPFRAAIGASVPLIMVANATYPAYDAARPASVSPKLIGGLLRDELGYDGVVVTDDLGAGALAGAGIDEAEAAVEAARAGADLLLFALDDGSAARRALVRAVRSEAIDSPRLIESCTRLARLRAGLVTPTGAQ